MLSALQPKPRPKRSKHRKTRTGCKTCRIRRVKCGEEKPSCLRCIQFRVSCDWYPSTEERAVSSPRPPQLLPKKSNTTPTVTRHMALSQPRWPSLNVNVLAPILASPSISTFHHEQEGRYFEVFCSKTAFEILPSLDSGALRQLILQASEREPSIRHAVIALGALDKTAETQREDGLHLDIQPEDPVEHHRNALKQYTIALKHMRAAASSGAQDTTTTLLTCLVIFCFEAWDGNKELAVRQVQTGLSLIENWREENSAGKRLEGSTPPYTGIVEDDLVRVFSRLDVQAISFAEKRSPERQTGVIRHEKAILDCMPQVFTSVQDAEVYENVLLRRAIRFVSSEVPLPKPSWPLIMFPVNGWWGERSPHVVMMQESIIKDIFRWEKAFEPVWKLIKAKDGPCLPIATVLRMHLMAILIALLAVCMEDEDKFDDYQDIFAEIVDLAEYSLEVLEVRRPEAPRFQFDSHVIIPLHIVGHKCRERTIRQRAISLLLSHPRREGVWDSTFVGRVAEWAMNVEEKCLENGKVPGWARIHGITYEPEKEPRHATLSCQQRLGPTSNEVVTRQKFILW